MGNSAPSRYFFQSLINWNGADWDGRISNNPFPGLVDIFTGRQVHYGIGAPTDRPGHFLNFFFDRRGHGRVADICVDLDQKISSYGCGLELWMVDVGWNDGTAASNLALTLGAQGGVFIAGGIIPRLGETFTTSAFRERFEDKGRFKNYLKAIPTFVITHETPALIGLAALLDEALL